MKYYCEISSAIGTLLLVSDGKFLIEVKINAKPEQDWVKKEELGVFQNTKKWFHDYFRGIEPKVKISLKMQGTDFQKEVWNLLLEIPYGEVVTYGDLAKQMAFKRNIFKMSSQAIGNAVHNNPIPIIVPCHRVVGKNKNLVGYGFGIYLKIQLLKLESFSLDGYYFYENQEKRFIK